MNQSKTILVLDAGGTNLVFNAVRDGQIVEKTFTLPAMSENLENLLEKIIHGFREINKQTGGVANAISFCFPGPADFENGIIGDLENLPFFRGGIPLKAMLENEFGIPVFINNDGDLFALGEAIGGILPQINIELLVNDVHKQYKNLPGRFECGLLNLFGMVHCILALFVLSDSGRDRVLLYVILPFVFRKHL